MKNDEVAIGEHCWALMGGKLVVALKAASDEFNVCGPWECGVRPEEIEILEVIPRPSGMEKADLYY